MLSVFQPAAFRRLGATLLFAKRGTLYPVHILHGQLAGSPDMHDKKLKSRCPFVPAARELLGYLSKIDTSAAQSTNYK